jgi:plastin-1
MCQRDFLTAYILFQDGEAYTLLLNILAPQTCTLSPLDIKDPLERAKALLIQADKIGCRRYVTPKDIVEGSTNLNLAFVANLFHARY